MNPPNEWTFGITDPSFARGTSTDHEEQPHTTPLPPPTRRQNLSQRTFGRSVPRLRGQGGSRPPPVARFAPGLDATADETEQTDRRNPLLGVPGFRAPRT